MKQGEGERDGDGGDVGALQFRTWAETNLALNINFVYLCACSGAHLVLLDNHSAATKLPTISFIIRLPICSSVLACVCACVPVLRVTAASCCLRSSLRKCVA